MDDELTQAPSRTKPAHAPGPAPARTGDFRSKTLRALKWSATGQFGVQLVRFGVGIVLARLLSPRDFGLIGMVTVITGFAGVFAEFGFGAALIQRKVVDDRELSSVFWLNVAIGALMSLLVFAAAPLVAAFYKEPGLRPVTMVLSALFVIRSLNIVQQTILARALNFRARTLIEFASVVISGIVAITLAVRGYFVYSLVIQALVGPAITGLLLWVSSSWRPSFTFKWAAVAPLLGFSTHLVGSQVLNYWSRNLDNLLIGRFLGSASLGIYSRAYSVMMFPVQSISGMLSRVMFPSFSLIQDDKARVGRLFLRATRTIAAVTFPLCFGISAVAESFVLAVFGAQWIGAVPILRILSIVAALQSVITLVGQIYLSQGRADTLFRLGLFTNAVVIGGILIGLPFGLEGVAVAYGIATVICAGPNYHFAAKMIGIDWRSLAAALGGLFAASATMAVVVAGASFALPAMSPMLFLAVQVALGAIIFISMLLGFRMEAAQDILKLYRERNANSIKAKPK